ncbi:hypothetical protein KAR91_34555 [Candidatus Pacearchaeota archaeon]|nr:hypothetical protein [Candidatus Pacearchaeota archaeon]
MGYNLRYRWANQPGQWFYLAVHGSMVDVNIMAENLRNDGWIVETGLWKS